MPDIKLNNPINATKRVYLTPVAFFLKVNFEFAKKLNVTATTKPTKLDIACEG